MLNVYEAQSSNKLKSSLIIVGFVVFVALAVYVISLAFSAYYGWQPGGLGMIGIAFIISGITTFISYYYSDRIVITYKSGDRKSTRLNSSHT